MAYPEKGHTMKVSIIIPVHNAANTIRETLLSVMNQAGEDMEIILIDDCSQDDSISVIEETAAGDPRVILLKNSTNLGVSAARNKGLTAANGEYIRFVDDDDPLPEGSINSMLEVAEANGSDLVIGIMEKVRLGRKTDIIATVALGARKVIDKYDPDLTQSFSVCNKMFRLNIIREHGIMFRPYRHAEDGLFLYEYLQYAKTINGCNRIVYTYMRPESFEDPTSSTSPDGDMLHDIIDISDRILGMHPDAPADFVESFNRKIASSALIGQYYRKLWMLEDADASFLLEELEKYRGRLSEATWNDVISKHPQLHLENGFLTKEAAAKAPVFTIVADPALKSDDLINLLRSAYYQREPLFRIVLADSCRDWLPDDLKDVPNIVFKESDQLLHRQAIDACDTPYIAFIEDPVIFHFETLSRAAALLQDEELDYVSGICRRMSDEKAATPELYRFAFAKENLGRSLGCSVQDRADPLLSNKLFRTERLRAFIHGREDRVDVTAPKLAESMRHERTRKVRYMTSCSDRQLRRRLVKASEDGSVLSAVRIDQAGGTPSQCLVDAVLFVSERQEMKPAFRKLYEDLQCGKEIFVRDTEYDPLARLSVYARYRTVLFESFDPALIPAEVQKGQNCYVLMNYLCRDSSVAELVLAEMKEITG